MNKDPDGIIWVHCGHQIMAGLLDGPHVARRDKASGAEQYESFHGTFPCVDRSCAEHLAVKIAVNAARIDDDVGVIPIIS